jgi:hypothetical protein
MKNHFFLILLFFFFLVSCNKSTRADHSLTPAEYQKLGMPEYNRPWNMQDFTNVFYVLNTLKYEKPKALPTRGSDKSGVLFAHMISTDNLFFLQDPSLPLHVKADKMKWFVNILMELKVAYTLIGTEEQYYVREQMDIDIFRMTVAHIMLDLGQQINASEDPSDVAMQSDYPKIREMYLKMIKELLEKQEHASDYPVETLELLTDSLSSSVKRNMDWFDEPASLAIKQAMLGVIDHSSSRKIRSTYRDITEVL